MHMVTRPTMLDKCRKCGELLEQRTVEKTETFEDGRSFEAFLNVEHCPNCPEEDCCTGTDLGLWEEAISAQLLQLADPTPDMHRFVRHTYGLGKPICAWLAKHIDQMPR